MTPKKIYLKLRIFFHNTLWRKRLDDCSFFMRMLFHFFRIVAITWHGFRHNRIMGQAAALGYATLMALGPVVAVAVMLSSYVLQDKEDDFITEKLQSIIGFVAAPAAINVKDVKNETKGDGEAEENITHELNPELVRALNDLVKNARSNTVGAVGAISLIIISILLIVTIENSLNLIWGIAQGRKFTHRVMLYWTWISLGAVLATATVGLISLSTLTDVLENLPIASGSIKAFVISIAPTLSFLTTLLLLMIFYRILPNTLVKWKPALIGALFATILLFLNKELSFIYINKVVQTQNLYGSIGIIPIFMFGMYIFWIIVLIGGQLSYAVQSAHFVSNLRAWENISQHTKESIALAALVVTSRYFKACKAPTTREELGEAMGVPINILNGCLKQLCDIGLLSPVEDEDEDETRRTRYQPARPLEGITLGDFKHRFERVGNDEGIRVIQESDPIIACYHDWLNSVYESDDNLKQNLNSLFSKMPLRPAST